MIPWGVLQRDGENLLTVRDLQDRSSQVATPSDLLARSVLLVPSVVHSR